MVPPRDVPQLSTPSRGPDRPQPPSRPARLLATALALLAMACAGDSSVDPIDVRNLTLTVEPTRLFIAEGQDGQLHARLVDGSGKSVPTSDLTWRSSDPSIVKVDDSGVVTGVETGSVFVTASVGGKKQSTNVNVKGKGKLEMGIVSGSGQSGPVGEMLPNALVVEVRDRTGSGVPGVEVGWNANGGDGSTSAPSTTTNQDGRTQVLWTLGPTIGGQSVQAKVSGAGTVEFTATGTSAEPASVTVSPDGVSLDVGSKQQFSATVHDKFGNVLEGADITWASTAADVLDVDNAGLATGMSAGDAVVEAYAGSASDGTSVEVTPEDTSPSVASIAASPEEHTFTALGQTVQLEAVAYDGSGEPLSGITYDWNSSDASIATVDDMGLVLAHAVGTALITVQAACCPATDTVAVTVTQVPAAVEVSPTSFTLDVGQTQQLSATVLDENGYVIDGEEVDWSSTELTVASIDTNGLVEALAEGSAQLEARLQSSTTSTSSLSTSSSSELVGTASGTVGDGSDGSSTGLLFSDGFESGDRSHSDNGASWGVSGGNVNVRHTSQMRDGAAPANGEYALEFYFKGPTDQISAQQKFFLGNGSGELWLEYWIYIPTNYHHRDDPTGSDNNKMFRLWGGDYGSSGRTKVGSEFHLRGDGDSNGRFMATQNGGAVIYYLSQFTNGGNVNPIIADSGGDVFARGEWTHFRYHVKLTSGVGQNDGAIEAWIGTQKIVDQTGLSELYAEDGINILDRGYLFGAANSGFDEDTYLYIDDIAFWATSPGW